MPVYVCHSPVVQAFRRAFFSDFAAKLMEALTHSAHCESLIVDALRYSRKHESTMYAVVYMMV